MKFQYSYIQFTFSIYVLINLFNTTSCTTNEEIRDRETLQKFLDDKRLGGEKGTRGGPSKQLLPVTCKSHCAEIPTAALKGVMQKPFVPDSNKWVVLDLGRHRAVGMVSLTLDTENDDFTMQASGKKLPLHRAFSVKLINDERFNDNNAKGHITVSTRDSVCRRTDTISGFGPLYTTNSDVLRLGERRMRVVSYVFYNAGKQKKGENFYYKHNLARAIKVKHSNV